MGKKSYSLKREESNDKLLNNFMCEPESSKNQSRYCGNTTFLLWIKNFKNCKRLSIKKYQAEQKMRMRQGLETRSMQELFKPPNSISVFRCQKFWKIIDFYF